MFRTWLVGHTAADWAVHAQPGALRLPAVLLWRPHSLRHCAHYLSRHQQGDDCQVSASTCMPEHSHACMLVSSKPSVLPLSSQSSMCHQFKVIQVDCASLMYTCLQGYLPVGII